MTGEVTRRLSPLTSWAAATGCGAVGAGVVAVNTEYQTSPAVTMTAGRIQTTVRAFLRGPLVQGQPPRSVSSVGDAFLVAMGGGFYLEG